MPLTETRVANCFWQKNKNAKSKSKSRQKRKTLAVWTHFNASLHFRLILSSLYQIHDTNFTRYPRIRSSLYEAMNEAWPRTKRWTLNFSILVLTASAILLKQKGYIFRCIYWIHVWESVSDSVMFLRFDKDMRHCWYCQGWSSELVVKVGRQGCCHCIT